MTRAAMELSPADSGFASFVGSTPEASMLPSTARMRFSLDDVPQRDRRSQLCEFFGRELTKYDVEAGPDDPIHVDVAFRLLPGLIMMSGQGYGYRAVRSRRSVAAEASDDVGLVINLGGALQVTNATREFALGDGEAVLASLAEPYCFTHRPPGRLLALRVPRAEIAPLVSGVDDLLHRRIPDGLPALKFLLDYVRAAEAEPQFACPQLQQLFIRHVYELMALAVGATRDATELATGRGLKAARLHAIKRDIAGNIHRSDLSVGTLAARHGLTPRGIQRLFETEGTTFTDYLVSQRLTRAHRLLNDLSRERDKITAIAWDCGFGDISHFNHLFRRQYGLAPSDVRAQARLSTQ